MVADVKSVCRLLLFGSTVLEKSVDIWLSVPAFSLFRGHVKVSYLHSYLRRIGLKGYFVIEFSYCVEILTKWWLYRGVITLLFCWNKTKKTKS